MMAPRLVFVIMSAVHSAATVGELARALAPHLVLVHHDFAQTPNFKIDAPNAVFVPEPKRTGWACWGFSEGIFHALRYAFENHEFDFLQLLSPTCLPIKPLHEFQSYVAASECTAHFDYVDVASDNDALMHVGYRAFTPENSLRHRIFRRLSLMYFGRGTTGPVREVAGVQLRTGIAVNADGSPTLAARAALQVMQASRHPMLGHHIFDESFRPCFGSVWFGARRQVVAEMVERFSEPTLNRHFSRLRIADEFLIPTLLRNSGASQAPGNHFVKQFVDAHPGWFEEDDFERLRQSPAYFARKFRDDPSEPIRRRVLEELVVVPTSAEVALSDR